MDPNASNDTGDVLGADAVADATADGSAEPSEATPPTEENAATTEDGLAVGAVDADIGGGADPLARADALTEEPAVAALGDTEDSGTFDGQDTDGGPDEAVDAGALDG